MLSKTEEKILIAKRPFIKKTNAKKLCGMNYTTFQLIWEDACQEYQKRNHRNILPLGMPTSFFLEQIGLTVEQLIELDEYEKKYGAK